MLPLFASVKALIKAQSVNIDSFVCKLHYRLTVLILLVFSILVTATQFFGDPIKCMNSGKELANDLIKTYCWIHSTYSVTSAWHKPIGSDVPYPGIDKFTKQDEVIYHTYYLWVPLVLFSMAVTFYIPRYLWKIKENGLIKSLVSGLKSVILKEEEKEVGLTSLRKYFTMNRGNNGALFFVFLVCEFLYLANVVFQMYFINWFLNGAFRTYGWDVFTYQDWNPEVSDDPMVRVFPTMTKCVFHFGGPSGDTNKNDVLCLLPTNILNQKIFVFLWVWFWFLLIVTLISFLYRITTIAIPVIRQWITAAHCYPEYRKDVYCTVRKLGVADWFLLELLSDNMNCNYFNEFVLMYRKTHGGSSKRGEVATAPV